MEGVLEILRRAGARLGYRDKERCKGWRGF